MESKYCMNKEKNIRIIKTKLPSEGCESPTGRPTAN